MTKQGAIGEFVIGSIVAGFWLIGIMKGEMFSRHRTVRRSENPTGFYFGVAVYGCVAVILVGRPVLFWLGVIK